MQIEIIKRINPTEQAIRSALIETDQDYGLSHYDKRFVDNKINRIIKATQMTPFGNHLFLTDRGLLHFTPDGEGGSILHRFDWVGVLSNQGVRIVEDINDTAIILSDTFHNRDLLRGKANWTLAA